MNSTELIPELLRLQIQGITELETRITREIRVDQFKSLAEFLNRADFERIEQPDTLDISFYTNNKKDNLSIRVSIIGLDAVRNYCRTEDYTQNSEILYKEQIFWPEEIVKKYGLRNKRAFVDIKDMDIRINLKTEINQNRFNDFREARIAYERFQKIVEEEGYENIDKLFRFKKRTSFKTLDGNFRVDLTMVKTNRKEYRNGYEYPVFVRNFRDSNLLNEDETYEVEVEYLGGNSSRIQENIIGITELMWSQLFSKTYTPIGKDQQKNVRNEFIDNIRQMLISSTEKQIEQIKNADNSEFSLFKTQNGKSAEENIQGLRRTLDMIRTNKGYYRADEREIPTQYFYGPKVVSMNVENLQATFPINIIDKYTTEDTKEQHSPYVYTVTDKADGETGIIYINNEGHTYLIDTNMNVDIVSQKKIGIKNCILIGEFIDNFRPEFYAFDCYLFNGEDTRMMPLLGDREQDDSRISRAHKIADEIGKIDSREISTHIHVKKFYWGASVFQLTKNIWDNANKYPYKLDGVIYTPKDMPVAYDPYRIDWLTQMGARWNYNLKWKPPHMNTIDFLIKIQKERINIDKSNYIEKEILRNETFMIGEKVEFNPYKTIELYNGFKISQNGNPCGAKLATIGMDANKYVATKFTPTNPNNPEAYLAKIPVDEQRGNAMFSYDDNSRIMDDTIVEFAYDGQGGEFKWKPLRTRVEKTIQYKNSLKQKQRLYSIYTKYRNMSIGRDHQWQHWEITELMSLIPILRKFGITVDLSPREKERKANNIYRTLNNRENAVKLSTLIESAIDMPVPISYGNDFNVANSIWRSIHFPITIEMITTGKDIPSIEDTEEIYYNHDVGYSREKSVTKNLQSFHNKIVKNQTLYSVAVEIIRRKGIEEIALLDLACGKGGDLHKWNQNKISNVVGIDISYNNIFDPKDGACIRYTEFLKRMESYGENNLPNVNFLYGDVSKTINTAEAMKNEDSMILAQKLWKSEPYKSGFDMVSMQFAIHYLFKDEQKLNGVLRNISDNLKPGGLFIGTCFDGATIYNKLYNKERSEGLSASIDNRIIWKIKKYYDNIGEKMPDNALSLGLAIEVYTHTINQFITEYLVNFDYLVRKMEEHNMGLKITGMFGELYNSSYKLTPEEKEISFFNRYFIFYKKSDMDIRVNELYNKLYELRDTIDIGAALRSGIRSGNWDTLKAKREVEGYSKEEIAALIEKIKLQHKLGNLVLKTIERKKALEKVLVEKGEQKPDESSKQSQQLKCTGLRKTKDPKCEDQPNCEWKDKKCVDKKPREPSKEPQSQEKPDESSKQSQQLKCAGLRKTKDPKCEDQPNCEWKDKKCVDKKPGQPSSSNTTETNTAPMSADGLSKWLSKYDAENIAKLRRKRKANKDDKIINKWVKYLENMISSYKSEYNEENKLKAIKDALKHIRSLMEKN